MNSTITKQVKKAHCNECGRKVVVNVEEVKNPKCVWCGEKYAVKNRRAYRGAV
ncbi:hypothetical protein FACS1894133_4470 [Clostridia bacterium]|nr:hypothetical protein FACS1894133_4470 [Clostridia bacterium]